MSACHVRSRASCSTRLNAAGVGGVEFAAHRAAVRLVRLGRHVALAVRVVNRDPGKRLHANAVSGVGAGVGSGADHDPLHLVLARLPRPKGQARRVPRQAGRHRPRRGVNYHPGPHRHDPASGGERHGPATAAGILEGVQRRQVEEKINPRVQHRPVETELDPLRTRGVQRLAPFVPPAGIDQGIGIDPGGVPPPSGVARDVFAEVALRGGEEDRRPGSFRFDRRGDAGGRAADDQHVHALDHGNLGMGRTHDDSRGGCYRDRPSSRHRRPGQDQATLNVTR